MSFQQAIKENKPIILNINNEDKYVDIKSFGPIFDGSFSIFTKKSVLIIRNDTTIVVGYYRLKHSIDTNILYQLLKSIDNLYYMIECICSAETSCFKVNVFQITTNRIHLFGQDEKAIIKDLNLTNYKNRFIVGQYHKKCLKAKNSKLQYAYSNDQFIKHGEGFGQYRCYFGCQLRYVPDGFEHINNLCELSDKNWKQTLADAILVDFGQQYMQIFSYNICDLCENIAFEQVTYDELALLGADKIIEAKILENNGEVLLFNNITCDNCCVKTVHKEESITRQILFKDKPKENKGERCDFMYQSKDKKYMPREKMEEEDYETIQYAFDCSEFVRFANAKPKNYYCYLGCDLIVGKHGFKHVSNKDCPLNSKEWPIIFMDMVLSYYQQSETPIDLYNICPKCEKVHTKKENNYQRLFNHLGVKAVELLDHNTITFNEICKDCI